MPERPTAMLAFAPGAGGGIHQPYIVSVCEGLATRGIASLRYQFPYMERRSRRPDPPALCHQTVQAAVGEARRLLPDASLYAGGKSFGGRMTSQAQALAPLPQVRGICFFGFPLHPPKQPATSRADHLAAIQIPMLFLQGTRDELAELGRIRQVVAGLAAPATLKIIDGADHSFHVPARSGRTDAQVLGSMLDEVAAWMAAGSPRR
ncbi:MAG TPA: alpha/beta family hydrolase [Steroidobacteraceae bacterium]|nr:alpha/beta family hydrolase [Steroidobacteraceae bacterium]